MNQNNFKYYWNEYGGWSIIVSSPYFKISFILSCILFYTSITGDQRVNTVYWSNLIVSINPGLLMFTAFGYFNFFGVIDRRFTDILRGRVNKNDTHLSPFIKIIMSFMHFTIVQILTLIIGVIGKSTHMTNYVYLYINIFMLIYSLIMCFAMCFSMFGLAIWYDDIQTIFNDNNNKNDKDDESNKKS